MKKKGMLLAEETLKLIIAVIAIGFLAYLLFSLYLSSQTPKETEQAKETLSFIMAELQTGKTTIEVYNPKNWWIKTWYSNEGAPQTCKNLGFTGCMCICKEDSIASCDESRVCVDEQGFSLENSIRIENPPITLDVEYGLKKISLKQ